jgi:hypothetical protein
VCPNPLWYATTTDTSCTVDLLLAAPDGRHSWILDDRSTIH